MKRKVSAIIMVSLMVLAVLVLCSSASADSMATFWGRVTPIGTTGTVEVKGPDFGSCQIGVLGFYGITVEVKHSPATFTITAHTNKGDQTKEVEEVYGGSYRVSFHFGGIIRVSYPQSKETSDIRDVTNTNPINNGQQTTGETVENEASTAGSSSTSTQSGLSTISWLQSFFQQLK